VQACCKLAMTVCPSITVEGQKMLRNNFLLLVAALALPSAAFAQDNSNETGNKDNVEIYAEARGGLSILPNTTYNFSPSAGPAERGKANTEAGYVVGAAIGLRFNDSIRVEGEYLYRSNGLKSVALPTFSTANSGDFNSVVIGANALYDLKGTTVGAARLRPYFGAGLAYVQEVDTDIVSPTRSDQFSNDRIGYQLLAGVNLEWESGLRAGLGARYTSASSVKMQGPLGEIEANYRPIALTASIGYRF